MPSKSWLSSIANPAKEFRLTSLKPSEGIIPASLNGALFRNGPARLSRGNQIENHWFDGDGAVLGLYFKQGKAFAQYKYVRTPFFIEEEKANKYLYESFSRPHPGGFFKRYKSSNLKNPANTSVLQLSDRLLALCEAGEPFALNSSTLEPIGFDSLGGTLGAKMTFSAHPKVDPITKEIYNVGLQTPQKLAVYRIDQNGKPLAKNILNVPWTGMVHDNFIAGKYFVTILFPLKANIWKLILGGKSFHESLEWKPECSYVYVFNRNDMSIACNPISIDPFWIFHFTNGFENQNGEIEFEFIKYKDYPTIDNFVSNVPRMPTQNNLQPELKSSFERMIINPKSGKVVGKKSLGVKNLEFPIVADSKVGFEWRNSFFSYIAPTRNPAGEWPGQIGKYDHKTDRLQISNFGDHQYPSEPTLVCSENNPEEGHILTVVFDAQQKQSEVWIHDSQKLDKEPLCRIPLPEIIPAGFHGKWSPNVNC